MITLWHNPRCSKSRQALALIEDAGLPFTLRRYLKDTPNEAEIIAVQKALGVSSALEMMRAGEKTFKEAGLNKNMTDAELIKAMALHPILIERPIAMKGPRAILGRPPEAINDLS